MKVRELLQKLNILDPDLEVVCYSEDKALVLDIEAVSVTDAERIRLDDGTPSIKIGKSTASLPLAVLEVTPEF